MQVFLSWSGDRSRELANALRDYLPLVIQSVTPWFSPDDIDKGSRWLADLTNQLQKQSVAIVCITPECVNSPWLLFEAGALSKALDASWVCPVLLDIEPSDIKGPLAQFQSTRVTKDDMRKLLATLNKRLDTPLGDPQIDKLHDILWSDFEMKIKAIAKPPAATSQPHRSQTDLLTEVLERVRGLERQISESNTQTPSDFFGNVIWRSNDGRIKPQRHFIDSTDQTVRMSKFRRLYETSFQRIAVLEESLRHLPEGNGDKRIAIQNELEKERLKLLSYEAEIGRADVKLTRSQQHTAR